MITLVSTVAFVLGMSCVWFFFRLTGILIALLFVSVAVPVRAATFVNGTTNVVVVSDAGGSLACCVPPGAVILLATSHWYGFGDAGASVNLAGVQASFVAPGVVLSLAPGGGGNVWLVSETFGLWTFNVWPDVAMGMGCAFVLAGFGWAFRYAQQGSKEW